MLILSQKLKNPPIQAGLDAKLMANKKMGQPPLGNCPARFALGQRLTVIVRTTLPSS